LERRATLASRAWIWTATDYCIQPPIGDMATLLVAGCANGVLQKKRDAVKEKKRGLRQEEEVRLLPGCRFVEFTERLQYLCLAALLC
jgi:hypothetical protein